MPDKPANDAPSDTRVEHIIRSIRDAVREGHLVQGQRLVVADISREFGTSAGPVREAIRRLAGEGLLEFTPHRGATVRRFTERQIREIFQVREAVEGYAARLAAENIHRSDFRERLTACRERLRQSVDAHVAHTRIKQDFHDLLYEIGGNSALQETAERLTSPLYRLRVNALTGQGRARMSLHEHEAIIDAILAGEGARAEQLMRAHLHNGARAVVQALAEETAGQTQTRSSKKGPRHA